MLKRIAAQLRTRRAFVAAVVVLGLVAISGALIMNAFVAGQRSGWHAGFVMGTDIGQSGAALCAIGKYPDWSQCQSFRAKMAEDVDTYAATDAPTQP